MTNTKICPYCAEEIDGLTAKCEYCESDLEVTAPVSSEPERSNSAQEVKAPPSPPSPPPSAQPVPPGPTQQTAYRDQTPQVQLSFKGILQAVKTLFGEEKFSVNLLEQSGTQMSFIIIGAVALLGPLLRMLVFLGNSSYLSGAFGRLFVNIFIAGSLYNLLSFGALFGLLYGRFIIRKVAAPIKANLLVTALVSLVMFCAVVFNIILDIVPWSNIAYVLITLIVMRYLKDTDERRNIAEPLGLLAIWLAVNTLVISRIINIIF